MKLCLVHILFALVGLCVGQTQVNQEVTAQDATIFFQNQDWENASKAYEAITKNKPENGWAWYRLGVSFHNLGKFEKAVTAFQKALEKMPEQAKYFVMYGLAKTYAKLKDKEKSFELLNKALAAGYLPIVAVQTDPDLQNLRQDNARFQELLIAVDRLTKPCLYQPEHKQFDFWIGEWNVQDEKGQSVGSSRIELIENGCIILENWNDGQGGTGKSLNFYDANLRKWRQTWADNSGGVSEFSGVFRDDAMRFEGESHTSNGAKILRRLTFYYLGANHVRQFSEASVDDGKTWTVNYDYTYIRKH